MTRLKPRITACSVVAALLLTAAPGAYAQFGGSNSLAPQDGMPLGMPSPLDISPDVRRGLAPVSPGSHTKTVLSLSALFFDDSTSIDGGLRWRIFADQADVNGNYPLVLETTDSKPFVTLDPGGYILHVAYGLAVKTEHVVIGTESVSMQIALDVGALRFRGMIGEQQIPANELEFEIHRADGTDEELVARVKSGTLLRLKAGLYQITSTYGQANAKIISEIRVEPGKLTEAAVLHKAGRIDLRLLGANGSAISDAVWSILTPGGDIVSEDLPSPKDVILAEGEYVAVARYQGQIFQKPFDVQSGRVANVDVAAVN